MNNTILNQYMPDYVSPPGETLLETLEELGMSQEDLQERSGISKKTIEEIITGKAAITTEIALQLEQVLNISASFWNNRERHYRDALAQQSEPQRLKVYKSEIASTSMTQQPIKPKLTVKQSYQKQSTDSDNTSKTMNIIDEILETIKNLKDGLKIYPIRKLVEHAQAFGPELKRQSLKTNQVRKFLDAINRLKANLTGNDFSAIETEVVLLKPKLAYAAARQDAVKSLSKVMSAAIDKVHSKEDFERLVQLIESIIAYHKAAGGE